MRSGDKGGASAIRMDEGSPAAAGAGGTIQ